MTTKETSVSFFFYKFPTIYALDSDLALEVSIIDAGTETGFMNAEIEFKTEDEAKKFTLPAEIINANSSLILRFC